MTNPQPVSLAPDLALTVLDVLDTELSRVDFKLYSAKLDLNSRYAYKRTKAADDIAKYTAEVATLRTAIASFTDAGVILTDSLTDEAAGKAAK